MSDCLFCKIAQKIVPTKIVKESRDLIVIKDIYPRAPVHLLIIPKKHITSIVHLDKKDVGLVGLMIYEAKLLAKRFKIAGRGYKLIFNVGREGGQVIDHLHLHLLGGKKLD